MSKIRILYVASEINPFLQTTEVSDFVRKLPQAMQEKGMEIRILVPRFGLGLARFISGTSEKRRASDD